MSILNIFRRKQKETEATRRAMLLRTGRITEGTIFDITTDESGAITNVFYSYEIGGVEYESSQTLDEVQLQHAADYYPGERIIVRFDPHQPTNSLVV